MREVKAFIRQKKTNEVIKELRNNNFRSVTVSEVEGTGQLTKPDAKPSLRFPVTHNKMTKLELICQKEHVGEIIRIINKYGSTGESGDGIISVSKVEKVFKVRTGTESREA